MVEYIDQYRHVHGVEPICEALKDTSAAIAPSTHYGAKARAPSARGVSDAATLVPRSGRSTRTTTGCTGPGSVTYFMHLLAKAFSDQRWTIHKVIAEGDTAVVYCTHSGRHTGDYFGLKPRGHRFAYKQMHMIRVVDGKGVEHWVVRDDASLMRSAHRRADRAWA
jgi:predicted ester cyclase